MYTPLPPPLLMIINSQHRSSRSPRVCPWDRRKETNCQHMKWRQLAIRMTLCQTVTPHLMKLNRNKVLLSEQKAGFGRMIYFRVYKRTWAWFQCAAVCVSQGKPSSRQSVSLAWATYRYIYFLSWGGDLNVNMHINVSVMNSHLMTTSNIGTNLWMMMNKT